MSQVIAPKAGVVRYRSGSVHPVYGLGSSWVVRAPFVRSAVAAAFSDRFGLVSDGASLSLLNEDFAPLARTSCVETNPVLGVSDTPDSAVAWLPSRNLLIAYTGKNFVSLAVSGIDPGAAVTAVSKSGSVVRLLETRPDSSVAIVEVALSTGQVSASREIAEARGRAALHGNYVYSVYENKLHLAPLDGAPTIEFPLEGSDVSFEQASSKSLHIASPAGDRNWIAYSENGHVALAELPAPAGMP